LRTRQGHLIQVGNLHVIAGSQQSADGKEKHSIPGKKQLAQNRFKLTCVRNVLEHMLPLHPAAPQGRSNMILAGDFNLVGQTFVWGLRENDTFRGLRCLCLGSEQKSTGMPPARDWIVTNMQLAEMTGLPLHVSADKQHAAVLGEWSTETEPAMPSALPAAPPAAPQGVDPAIVARMEELRARLMAKKREHEQQQENQDRAVQMGTEEEPEEASEVEDEAEAEEQPLRVRRRVTQALCLVVGVVVVAGYWLFYWLCLTFC